MKRLKLTRGTELDAAWNVAQANGFPFHHHAPLLLRLGGTLGRCRAH